MSPLTTVLRRVVGLGAAVLLSSFAVFLVPFVSPGDPVRALLRARMDFGEADDATVQAYAEQFGLHDPMLVQFGRWLGRFFTGDMGLSHISGTPVADQLLPAIGVTLSLAGSALLVAMVVSVLLGVISATRAGQWPDKLITSITHALIAIPEYALAPLLVLLFAVRWSLLPSAGYDSPASLVLPVFILALRPISFFTVAVRSGVRQALDSEHVLAARARGLSRTQALARHVVPHGLLPLWTMVGVWFAGLLGGSVIVEVIFAIPGMGRLIFDSIVDSDIPVAQGGVVVVVTCAVLVTGIIDLIHKLSDPNVRIGVRHG
ncbi:ABC transporter permease [Arthrobacter sp. NIO-1057]|uniref:ABC transporter permease n=1 Tax=Arthrobacter sp. NIO-1057 TaxID=993071 RepID=UPI00071E4B90|nr:ABC transporter permease [Arthrobacter sp. NIO-1057]KSU65971.1 ABC transporter permease [Arthrobacter sp. NIO-1057]SCC28794.1 peptide/nickel transport system permease protein [Arthrobacter sp. NIO-1057]